MPGGRPFKIIDAAKLGEIERLAQIGCNWAQVSAYMKISQSVLRKNKLAQEHYKRGGAMGIALVAGVVLKAASRGESWACQFYLRTRAGWKDGVVTAQQDGPDEQRAHADAIVGIEQRLARIREVQAEVINTEGPEVVADVVTPEPVKVELEPTPEPAPDYSQPPIDITNG